MLVNAELRLAIDDPRLARADPGLSGGVSVLIRGVSMLYSDTFLVPGTNTRY